MRLHWLAIVCAATLSVACGGGASKDPAARSDAKADTQGLAPAVTPVSNPGVTTEFGVKECDDYFARYTACVSAHVPAPVRAAMVAALDQSKNQWRAAAATPDGRAGLAEACTQALDAAKASMQAYGCRW